MRADSEPEIIISGAFIYVVADRRVQRRTADDESWEELDVRSAEGLVALSDGSVRIVVFAGALLVFAADGTYVRGFDDFAGRVGHRLEGGWQILDEYEEVQEYVGGWSSQPVPRRVWSQMIVRVLGDAPIEVGHYDARAARLWTSAIVLADGSLRIETSEGVFVLEAAVGR